MNIHLQQKYAYQRSISKILQDLLSLTSVAMVDGGEASLRNGCCRSSNAEERLNGSFCKHASMKVLSFGETYKKKLLEL